MSDIHHAQEQVFSSEDEAFAAAETILEREAELEREWEECDTPEAARERRRKRDEEWDRQQKEKNTKQNHST